MTNAEKTILEMNRLGGGRIPFVFIIDFEMKSPILFPLESMSSENILFNINGFANYTAPIVSPRKIFFKKHPVSIDEYAAAFKHVVQNINLGNSYLINLTFPTEIETNLSLKEIFYLSVAPYKLLAEDKFVVFSPESFIRIFNEKIFSFPMKGTIDANLPLASELILNDEKEKAEHTTIVDLIRNDLSIVSQNVKVERFRYVEMIKTIDKDLYQVSSEISGELPNDYHSNLGSIIFKLLPAGSISGAPKKKTIEIIKETENYQRGFYTGVFGYFDGNNLDSAVMIRFIEKIGDKLFYKSGGGITARSKLELEYQEMIDKVYVPIVRND
jgi:para-aminobenzoate synthetase component 1